MVRELRDGNLEASLDGSHNLLIGFRRDEGDRKTLGTETTSTTDAMQVCIGILW